MNTSMKPPDLLESAATLVERALTQLDPTYGAPCGTCGARRPKDRDHARVSENIGMMPERLRRGARILRGEET